MGDRFAFFKKNIIPFITSLIIGFQALKRPSQLIFGFLGILGSWLVSFIQYSLFLFLMAGTIKFWWGAFANTIMAMGIALPSAPAGLGIFETSIVAALNLFGINQALALAYAIILHVTQFFITAFIGLYALLKDGHSIRGLFSNLLKQQKIGSEEKFWEWKMSKKYLITGGAGFIGSNYVYRLLKRGEDVVVYDNLSRSGSRKNLEWLINEFGQDGFELVQSDIRDLNAINKSARDADVIVHLAAQVAVTTSVENPRDDFEVNALGTFNVLEAARLSGRKPSDNLRFNQ